MISTVIADDHGIVREGLRRLIDAEPDLEVWAEAADGCEALEHVARLAPDVVVLDISMPRLGGLETLERIRADHPGTKVILFSAHGDEHLVESAISLGANGYVLKDGLVNEIVIAIRDVMIGGSHFSPGVSRVTEKRLRTREAATSDPFALLSRRERDVLQLIAEGLSAKEVATRLSISPKTVESHRTSLMRKLELRKSTELVRYALRHGMIEL